MSRESIRSRVLHVTDTDPLTWEYLEDGVLVVEDGKISDLGSAGRFRQEGMNLEECDHRPGELLIPGFIDTHVHSPQIDVIASHGEQLLDWLDRYTFPAEQKYADSEYARQAAGEFLDGLLAAGTTTAMIFATSHRGATDSLFDEAHDRRMRIIAGKVLMDQHAPAALCDSTSEGVRDSRLLIEKWHGRGRLGYAVTPRFAVSSSSAQLEASGRLHADYPDTWVQTHLSENHEEIAKVAEQHPGAADYLAVYEQYGLVTDRAFFGHCLHLSDSEVDRLSAAGAVAVFCPSSNLFLGSGLFDVARMKSAGVRTGMATDVGGGTSLSMLRTLGDAYKVCQLNSYSLSGMEAFSMATLANAQALGLDDRIGNLKPGSEADFLLLKPPPGSILARRLLLARSIEEEIFIYVTMGDESVISDTFVSGQSTRERA